MEKAQTNYKAASFAGVETAGRMTFKDILDLSGSELSVNALPAGISIPFTHSHKRNEEVYVVLSGKGQFYVDGEEFAVAQGSVIRVSPAGERCLKADASGPVLYLCIQTEANSLVQATENDGVIVASKPSWL
ncbi:cupin domain-containing protein [Solidesulfovibrio sp.]